MGGLRFLGCFVGFFYQHIAHTTFQMSILGIKIKPFLDLYLETLDHAKIQKQFWKLPVWCFIPHPNM